jgi:hypothetical protein
VSGRETVFKESMDRAELARPIVQAHHDAESAPAESGCRGETAWDGFEVPPELPLAPQLQVYGDAPEQTSELDEHYDDGAYDVDDQPCADEDKHQDEATRVRRPVVAMAMFSLALAGTVGAFGYRAMIGGALLSVVPPIIKATNQPVKVAPASNEPRAKKGANASQVDTETTGSIEKLVSREEQPVRIEQPKQTRGVISTIPLTRGGSLPGVGTPTSPAAASQVPRRVAAAANPSSQSAGPSSAGDVTATSKNAHLAAAPVTLANANSTADVTPPASGGRYTVQVTSERSESGAQAAFRVLKARYPNQLSGRQAIIRRADLGAAGTYYRALVGPFASAEKAAKLCSGLKAAGADCIIQKN